MTPELLAPFLGLVIGVAAAGLIIGSIDFVLWLMPRPVHVRLPAPEDSEHPVFSAEMMIAYAAAYAVAAEEPESP